MSFGANSLSARDVAYVVHTVAYVVHTKDEIGEIGVRLRKSLDEVHAEVCGC